jgi:hypothetical protein
VVTRAAPHPDFTTAPVHRRWRGRSLRELWATMERWARYAARDMSGDGLPVWYVLEGGALVSLNVDGTGRRVLRIARSSKPADPTAFARECAVFAQHFGITGWTPERDDSAPGIAAIYREPATLFDGACACGKPFDPNAALYDGEQCSACKMSAKREGVTHG